MLIVQDKQSNHILADGFKQPTLTLSNYLLDSKLLVYTIGSKEIESPFHQKITPTLSRRAHKSESFSWLLARQDCLSRKLQLWRCFCRRTLFVSPQNLPAATSSVIAGHIVDVLPLLLNSISGSLSNRVAIFDF